MGVVIKVTTIEGRGGERPSSQDGPPPRTAPRTSLLPRTALLSQDRPPSGPGVCYMDQMLRGPAKSTKTLKSLRPFLEGTFIRQFYDSPSQFLWEDEMGEVRKVNQG